MTEITLKVLPAPERRGTLVLRGPRRRCRAWRRCRRRSARPTASPPRPICRPRRPRACPALAGACRPLVRLEDFASFVAYRSERLRADLAAFGPAEILDDAATAAAWAAVRDAAPLAARPGAIWRVSVRPSAGPAVAAAVERTFGARWFLDWGGGLVWIAGPATEAAHDAVCAAARRGRRHLDAAARAGGAARGGGGDPAGAAGAGAHHRGG